MIKYLLTFTKVKTNCIVSYANGQFKKLEYKSGGMKNEFWTNLTQAIPFEEHHIKDVVNKWNGRIQFEVIKPTVKSDFSLFIDVYYNWFQTKYSIKPKWTEVEGKALKQIITYLNKETANSKESLTIWQQIFTNWNKLDNYYQGQNQLKQINGNFQIILTQLKDGKPSSQARKKANSNANDIRESL